MSSLFAPSRPVAPLGGDRMRAVLLAALLTVVVEIGVLIELFGYVQIGRAIMPVSVFPGAVVLALLGRRAFGRRTGPGHTDPFWAASIIGLAFCTVLLAQQGHYSDGAGVIVAALGEEVVYRFAVPAVVAAILISLHVPARTARIGAFTIAGTWFVLLPWHRAQISEPAEVAPFVAFAALSGLVAYRSGSIAATAAVHSVMNMMALMVASGDISRTTRSASTFVLMVMLVWTYGLIHAPAMRTAPVPTSGPAPVPDLSGALPADAVIDLRDGVLPTHTSAEGEITPLVESKPTRVEVD